MAIARRKVSTLFSGGEIRAIRDDYGNVVRISTKRNYKRDKKRLEARGVLNKRNRAQ